MSVQVRLEALDSNGTSLNATVISAVVIQQGDAEPVQIEGSDDNLLLYVHDSLTPLPDSPVVVTDTTVYSSIGSFMMSGQNSTSTDYVSISYSDEEGLVVSLTGASVTVSSSLSILSVALQLDDTFINDTEGLLGYFNRIAADDFLFPNGTYLSANSSEEELFYFGLECKNY